MAEHRPAVFWAVALALHAAVLVLLPHARQSTPTAPRETITTVDLDTQTQTQTQTQTLTPTHTQALGTLTPTPTQTLTPTPTPTPHDSETTTLDAPSLTSLFMDPSRVSVTGGGGNGMETIGVSGHDSYRMDVAKEQPPAEETIRHSDILSHTSVHTEDGLIVGEIERTTRRLPGTPFEGHAIFAVAIDSLGLVVSVGVDESSGDRQAWDEVATATLNALAQKRLRVPAGARGIEMRIEVGSKVTLPSGAQHAVELGPSGLTFDLSDIGAHRIRTVAAHVVSENTY